MRSIPKIYTLGTRFNADIFDGPVVIEEKIDGSQFSFGIEGGQLVCRSKSTIIDQNDPGMFRNAVASAQLAEAKAAADGHPLPDGAVFQCEYLAKPKHNVLTYSRVPQGYLVLFDVCNTKGEYATSSMKSAFADDLGLEPVPAFYEGRLNQFTFPAYLEDFLLRQSVLGGTQIEGIVIKNYGKSHPESESGTAPMTAKIVSDRFKEKMVCRPQNPKAGPGDFVQSLVNSLRTEARWLKAIQHLREAGKLVNDNRDIGPLCKEIQADILAEEADWIKQRLFDEFAKEIVKGTVTGFAQFYQKLLANGPSVYQETYQLTAKMASKLIRR